MRISDPNTGGLSGSGGGATGGQQGGGNPNVGRVSINLSSAAGSIGQSAYNLAGVATGLAGAVVKGVKGLPIVGPAVLDPVISGAEKLVGSTIGSAIPKGVDMKGAVEFANAPTNYLMEGLTGISQTISEAVLRARIQNTIENKWDITTMLFGNAPASVIQQYRRGAEIYDIAESWVNKFGEEGSSQYGAFSSDGLTNFLWTTFTDPLTYVPVGKPFQLASRAATLSKMGGRAVLEGGLRRTEEELARLIASKSDDVIIAEARRATTEAAKAIKFYNRWETAGDVWKVTFGRIGDLRSRVTSGPLAKRFVQSWTRVIATDGGDWALGRISGVIGKEELNRGLGDVVLTTANAAKAEMVQVATQAFRNRFDEAAENIVKRLHELVTSGSTIDDALDAEWAFGKTIRGFLSESDIPAKELDDLIKIFSEGSLPDYKLFKAREGTYDTIKRIGSTISNAAVAGDPDYLLRVGSVIGESNLRFANDAAVDVLTRESTSVLRYSQSPELGIEYLTRTLSYGWGMTREAAEKVAKDAFTELGAGSRELLDVVNLARMKAFGKLIRETATARAIQPKSSAELPETISRVAAISESFGFDALPKEEATAAATILDNMAQARASRMGVTIDDWYKQNMFGIKGVSLLDDALAITETLNKTVAQAKVLFENATPEEILRIAESIQPTERMISAAKESGVKTLSQKSKIEMVTFPGADKPFALPGGLKGLESAEPFGLIDEVIIQAQPSSKLMPGAARIKMYKKIWASKGIDFQNNIEVTNRVIFGLLSANTGLSPNAAMYTLLRVRNAKDLATFASTWGGLVKGGAKESVIGRKFKLGLPGAVEVTEDGITKIKYPSGVEGELRGIEISDTNVGRAIKALVFSNDNPGWFTLQPNETSELLAERLTFLSGAGVKVGTFAVEVMDPSRLNRGAIDKQMSAYIFDHAVNLDKNGLTGLDELVNDILRSGNTEKEILGYFNDMIPAVLDDGVKYKTPNGVEYIGNKTKLAQIAEGKSTSIGVSAPQIEGQLRLKGWNKPVSPSSASMHSQLPEYIIPKTPNVGIYEGSVAETMNNWIDRISISLEKDYPGISKLTRAQKQWFLWDLKRGNIEPHSWINRGVDAMEKPTMEQLGRALTAIGKAGGMKQGEFGGVNPKIIAEFFQSRGEQILGSTSFASDGRAIIKLFKGSDISTAIHEIGHVARRQLLPEENAAVLDIYGVTDGKWTVLQEEKFADDFTNYLYNGEAPTKELEDIFYKIRNWISAVWSSLSGNPVKEKIDPRMKKVFDGLFVSNGESLVAPTQDFYSRITLTSERTMTQSARRKIMDRVDYLLGKSDGGKVVGLEEALGGSDDAVAKFPDMRDNGATFNPVRGTKAEIGQRGFSVGIRPEIALKFTGAERERILSDREYLKRAVSGFVKTNEKDLQRESIYVGVYDSPKADTFYIDLSRVYGTADAAIATATKLGEESIFNLKIGEPLYMATTKGELTATLSGKKVVRSAAEIADLESYEIRGVPDEAGLAELKEIAKGVVDKFDDPAAHFFNTPYSWEDVITHVRQHPEVTTRELNAIEAANLPQRFKDMLPGMELSGYRFGVAPQNGVVRRMAWASDRFGNRYMTRQASPFVDLLDHVAVSKVDELSQGARKIPNSFDRLSDKFFTYGAEVVKNNYVNRLISSLAKKNISVSEAEEIATRVSNLAYKKETRVQGLWFERDEIEGIFRKVLGRERFEKYIEGSSPVKDIMEAAAGDVSVVGLTSGFTGRAKAWKPVIGAGTDRAYPLFRFGSGNPVFQKILEPIETFVMKLVDDIRTEYRRSWLSETDSSILTKMSSDNRSVNLEVGDVVFRTREAQVNATLSATQEAKGFVSNVNRVVKDRWSSGKEIWNDPLGYKEVSKQATAGQIATREWQAAMSKYAPEYFPDLAKHYGVTDGTSLVRRIIEDMLVASNPAALERVVASEARDVIGLYSKTLVGSGLSPSRAREIAAVTYGVWTDSMIRATRIADKMQYFSPMRSWFERSINHPVLGLYPYSYMTQKAIPAMLKLMFAPRIGGWVHPGLGFVTYTRFKEMVVENTESNEGFLNGIVKSPEIGFALSILVPALPDNLGFGAPGWLRRAVLKPMEQGREPQLSNIPEEFAKTFTAGTFPGQVASFAEAFASINTPLSEEIKASRERISEGLLRGFNE